MKYRSIYLYDMSENYQVFVKNKTISNILNLKLQTHIPSQSSLCWAVTRMFCVPALLNSLHTMNHIVRSSHTLFESLNFTSELFKILELRGEGIILFASNLRDIKVKIPFNCTVGHFAGHLVGP